MEARSAREIPGRDSFYEHVHMNFRGNYLLAKASPSTGGSCGTIRIQLRTSTTSLARGRGALLSSRWNARRLLQLFPHSFSVCLIGSSDLSKVFVNESSFDAV
jgi:hypothetical protein